MKQATGGLCAIRLFTSHKHAAILSALALCLCAGGVAAEDYPDRPITMIVPFAAGGPTDIVARALATAMEKALKVPLAVSNVGGAGGTLGANKASKAAPDGYTLLLNNVSQATAPTLYPKLGYDPVADFEPIGLTVNAPMTLIAGPGMVAANFKELSAYLTQAKAGAKIGNGGIGSASHLCGLLLLSKLNVGTQTIPFKGTGPAMSALLAGNINILCDQTTGAIDQIRANKVKVYGVTTKKRIELLPNVPTLAESGLPDFEVIVWHGLYAPKGTPKPILDKLVAALQTALKDGAFKNHMAELGTAIVAGDQAKPEALRHMLKTEIDKWSPVIKKAGVYAE